MPVLSAAVVLFLVMDPLGNVPAFTAILRSVRSRKRSRVIVREHTFAFLALAFILFAGQHILAVFHIDRPALGIAGGIILFLIALRLIFHHPEGLFGPSPRGEPFIVPLAIPLLAGPSAMATVLLISTGDPARWADWLLAVVGACAASMVILLFSVPLSRLLGEKVLYAFQRLMGLILTAVAVQMFLTGVKQFMAE